MMHRRQLPWLAGGLLAAPTLAMPRLVRAQAWPVRPVTMIVPWAAGGGADSVTRVFVSGLEQEIGQPVNVVNRTGGSGVVGHTAISMARPDGYTLGVASSEISTFRALALAEISPDSFDILSRLATIPAGVTVAVASPWRSVRDMLDAIKAGRKGQYTASGSGLGGSWHIALAGLLRAGGMAADTVRWVPSQGGAPAMQDVVAGGISMATCSPIEGKGLIDAGQARSLAVMGRKRLEVLPNVPTLAEGSIEWFFENWFALVAPRGLPDDVLRRVLEVSARAQARPEVRNLLAQRGIVPVWETPEEAGRFAREYATTASDLLRALGIAKA
ncbi:tripartite tricarboxylate transporter substrate binding protein [Pseudoroseomonas globiformis]|uniref:Tripartite tricarboxylate transporter substrate binding protein n=1 Tax=Teichococcus globiformis TaxID=2307229 RepID=A0ABV7G8L6_9PROT